MNKDSQKGGLIVYRDLLDLIGDDFETVGKAFAYFAFVDRGIMREDDIPNDISGRFARKFLEIQSENDIKYKNKCERNRRNGSHAKRAILVQDMDMADLEKIARKVHVPTSYIPTFLEQLEETDYCRLNARGNSVKVTSLNVNFALRDYYYADNSQ